jgi:hypothetical protein
MLAHLSLIRFPKYIVGSNCKSTLASNLSQKLVDKVYDHSYRHAGQNRHPEVFEIPGFRVAPAIASLPGMTIEFCCGFSETGH